MLGRVQVFVCLLVVAVAAPVAGQTGYAVNDSDSQLYSVDFGTGTATAIGATGFDDIEGLAFDAAGVLYGVDDDTEQLVTCSTATGACVAVGPLGLGGDALTDFGLAFDCAGTLFLGTEDGASLYTIDTTMGTATLVGAQGTEVTALASRAGDFLCASGLYGIADDDNAFGCLNTSSGAFDAIGPLGFDIGDAGLGFDLSANPIGVDDDGDYFTIDRATGAATILGTLTCGAGTCELEAFATPSVCGITNDIPTLSSATLAALVLLLAAGAVLVLRRLA
jgi:hypothetical protein